MNAQKAKALLEAAPPAPWDIKKVILNSPQVAGALELEAVCKITEQAPATLAVAIKLAEALEELAQPGRLGQAYSKGEKALAAWEAL